VVDAYFHIGDEYLAAFAACRRFEQGKQLTRDQPMPIAGAAHGHDLAAQIFVPGVGELLVAQIVFYSHRLGFGCSTRTGSGLAAMRAVMAYSSMDSCSRSVRAQAQARSGVGVMRLLYWEQQS
jgi:hypothetical protein